ncbi:MAG: hypothetical protein ABIG89_03575 [Candidatus Woesearchaeota archaeon]
MTIDDNVKDNLGNLGTDEDQIETDKHSVYETNKKNWLRKTGGYMAGLLGSLAVVGVLGLSGMVCYRSCAGMMPGEANDVKITDTESYEEFDSYGGMPIGTSHTINIEGRRKCIYVPDDYVNELKEGTMLEQVSWDFRLVPWRCNQLDEYRVKME